MRLDCHVHIVGNGSGGTGCWLRPAGWRWPLQALMVRHIGLPVSALRGDLDALYVAKLLEWVRGSSLDAAVILAHENVYDSTGRLLKDYGTIFVPNHYVLDLAKKHPEFLPAVSIHPARLDAMEELERCIADGAVMMKCLPNCQNIDCTDRRFTKFWERMAQAGMPLLAHTGGEHTIRVVRPEFADPRILDWPLQCGVTVIAAHAGGRSGISDPEYFHHFKRMALEHPRFYGDNSAFNIPIRSRLIRPCLEKPLADKIIHGSDYPVPVFGHWAAARAVLDEPALRRWQGHPNVLERDRQFKLAMGFPERTFTRLVDLLPRHVLDAPRSKSPADCPGPKPG